MSDMREQLKSTGAFGEQAAALWLEMLGWSIAARNFRCRFGEIDIVAQKGGFISFVEVKTRAKGALVSGEEAVDANKRRKVRLAAQYYLQRHESASQPRFDVIIVELDRGEYTVINYIENAF